MIRTIAGWSLRFRMLVLGLAAAMLLYGYVQLPNVPVDIVPDFSPPYVEVQTEALGLAADEVEQLITVPLEADLLQGVAFLDTIESESVAGLSSIVMRFDPGTDIFRARQVVSERLTQAHALPNVSKPPLMLQPLSSTSRVLMVSLTASDMSLIDMSILAQWTIRPRLLGVPGVANVSIWGQRDRQLQVLVDPFRLQQQRISLQHVLETAGNAMWVSPLTFLDASTPGTGGFIDTPNQRLGIQHVFPISTAADLEAVPLAPEDTGGRIVLLGDVADVVEDHQPLIGDAVVGEAGGLLLVIEKFPGADTLSVTRGVEAALDAMRPGLSGIEIDSTVFRPATYIEESLGNLSLAALLGFLLLTIVLVGLFADWRAALVALLAIPLSLAAAALVLHLLGTTMTAIAVAGLVLAVGLVVDEVVVAVHAIERRLSAPRDGDAGRPQRAIVLEAIVSGRGPAVIAGLVALLVVAPLFATSAAGGAFLPRVAIADVVAVLASMVVAVAFVPALGSLILRPRGEAGTRATRWLQQAHGRLLGSLLGGRRPTVVTVATIVMGLVVVAMVVATPRLGQAGTPTFRERDLLISWDAAPGTSRLEMDRIVGRVAAELRTLPGVTNVGAHVGRALVSDRVVGINSGELWASLDPAADYDATVAAIGAVVAGYPGLDHVVRTFSAQRIGDVLSTTADDIVVRVYGQDLDGLVAQGAVVRDAVATIDGVSLATVETQALEPTVEIEVDLGAAESYGIKAGDVRRAAAILLSGVEVGSIFEDQKIFSVVVWGRPEIRQSVSAFRELPVQAPGGAYVRLGDIADVRIAPAPTVIRREGVFRRLDVGIAVSGRDLNAVIADVDGRLGQIAFPHESHAEIRATGADRQAELIRLLAAIAVAAIWSILLLQAALGSWRLAGLLFVALPAALAGGFAAALAAGSPASLGVLLGGLAVLAVAGRQAVVLCGRARELELAEPEAAPDELVRRAARDRLVPTLTTSLGVAGALLPAVLLGNVAGLEIVQPMAIVIIGGLVTATVFNLLVVPVLYRRSGPHPAPDPATWLLDQPGESAA